MDENTKDNISNIDQNQNEAPVVHYSVMPDLEGIGKPPPPPPAEKKVPKPAVQPQKTNEPDKPKAPTAIPSPPPAPKAAANSSEVPVPPVPHKPQASIPPKPSLTKDIKVKKQKETSSGGHGYKKYLIMVGAILLALVILGAAGYVLYNKNYRSDTQATDQNTGNNEQPADTNPTPQDSDNDGLTDQEEANYGTDPNEIDSDSDGLADGDEVNLFNTNPLSLDSDGDQFDDSEVQGGFSPTVPGDARLSETEIENIIRAAANNEIHEITRQTLLSGEFWADKINASVEDVQQTQPEEGGEVQGTSSYHGGTFTYEDPVYGYQILLPGEWKKSPGSSPTNIVFTEVGSPVARYVQVQAFVSVDNEGKVDNSGIVENQVKRLSNVGMEGVSIRNTTISGKQALRLSAEFERGASTAGKASIKTSTVEYVLDTNPAAFVVTAVCSTTTGISCMSELDVLAGHIEQNLVF